MSDTPPTVQITIPTIGTVLTLTRGWTFLLHHEGRNRDFAAKLGVTWKGWGYSDEICATEVTLPSGTELIVDRIYIRKGKGKFDSITFRLKKTGKKAKVWGRFWAKLGDVNRVHCTWSEDTLKRDTKVNIISRLADLVL